MSISELAPTPTEETRAAKKYFRPFCMAFCNTTLGYEGVYYEPLWIRKGIRTPGITCRIHARRWFEVQRLAPPVGGKDPSHPATRGTSLPATSWVLQRSSTSTARHARTRRGQALPFASTPFSRKTESTRRNRAPRARAGAPGLMANVSTFPPLKKELSMFDYDYRTVCANNVMDAAFGEVCARQGLCRISSPFRSRSLGSRVN